jgi:hypothetical protein
VRTVDQESPATISADVPAVRFRPFKRREGVQGVFEAASIPFLAAHQSALLPPTLCDVFVNISCLHER